MFNFNFHVINNRTWFFCYKNQILADLNNVSLRHANAASKKREEEDKQNIYFVALGNIQLKASNLLISASKVTKIETLPEE